MDELAKVYKRAQSPDERRLILARGEELPDRTSQDQVKQSSHERTYRIEQVRTR